MRALIWSTVMAVLPLAMPTWADDRTALDSEFDQVVRPFLSGYCTSCHSGDEPEAKFDLTPYTSSDALIRDAGHLKLVLQRLREGDMPPDDAPRRPDDKLQSRIVDWIERLLRAEAVRTAGDPGIVLARRLSNAEYNYSIYDLTGVDIQPTRDFPVDPANEAGFDNTGESLTMSPALLNKYLAAARHVADHLLFLPDGLDFAPYPVVVYSDRDKYCVHRIVDFYDRQPIDYADYFYAAWRYRHRAALRMPGASLDDVAAETSVSAKYLRTVWELLTDVENHAGPVAVVRDAWQALPSPDEEATVRADCDNLRDTVQAQRRSYFIPLGDQYAVQGLNLSTQPMILLKDRDFAANRRQGVLPESDGSEERDQLREAIARFCSVFPDTFYVRERGRMYESGLDKALDPSEQSTGRLLSAGFHLMLGYFRDDAPLYDLILDEDQQRELDRMWHELVFVTRAPIRQFSDYIYFERAERPSFLERKEFDFVREDTITTSPDEIDGLRKQYLATAREAGITEDVLDVIDAFYVETSKNISGLNQALIDAEAPQLDSLLELAERAWQRPLTDADRADLLAFYRVSRDEVGLGHEDSVRDTLVSVLLSPRFSFRVIGPAQGSEPEPLSDFNLAGRLSYFLWSSLPDRELLEHAKAGTLHDPDMLLDQTRRMLRDPRISRLATEFGGNWLEFRRFETHAGVNRERFPQFTDELREAMYEEPIRFITDLVQRDGSIFEFLTANHTFVNAPLAKHYGVSLKADDSHRWQRIDDAGAFGRGGMLPMSVFLTKNSPGLRTSPVKRGYWVVRRVLGEQIPPPPPQVPDLPEDEAKLGELSLRDVLERHRAVESCAQCHERFDSIGLVFEGYGPIGEKRTVDLGERPVDDAAEFPDGSAGRGIDGLRRYLREARQQEFIENLCRKLLSYGLGRSLALSDELAIEEMMTRLEAEDYRFGSMVETIVASPQFLRVRGQSAEQATGSN